MRVDVILGNDGSGFANTTLHAGDAAVVLRNIENVTGSRFGDDLEGSGLGNTLRGMAGDDVLTGRGGADLLVGGAGRDRAVVADIWDFTSTGAVASLLRGRVGAGEGEGIPLQGIENLIGGGGNDVLTGDHQRNLIYTGYGDDTLIGNGGTGNLITLVGVTSTASLTSAEFLFI